jgi:DNA-binding MarR family transcriptional regulator
LVQTFWTFWPAFQRWADSQTQEDRLTPQRARILSYLHENGPSIMSSLKEELGVTATNITALVDALEKDGLVARKAHPTDRRATLLEVTAKAECELMKGCQKYSERVGGLFSVLSEADRRELLRMLDALKAHLDVGKSGS